MTSSWGRRRLIRSWVTSVAAGTIFVLSGRCCCGRCTPSTTGSAGSAGVRSTTSPPAWTSRRPTSMAWRRSTRCSRRSNGLPARSMCASTSSVGRQAALSDDQLPAGAHPSPCLGVCERAPAALVIESGDPARHEVMAPSTAEDLGRLVGRLVAGRRGARGHCRAAARRPVARAVGASRHRRSGRASTTTGRPAVTRRCGGRWRSDRRPSSRRSPTPGLVGRGGAAFPTGRKWDAVARQPVQPHLPRVQRRRVRARHVQGSAC